MASIAGHAAAVQGRPFTDCGTRNKRGASEYMSGYVRGLVSQKSQNSGKYPPFNVKHIDRSGRPDWSFNETILLEVGLVGGLDYEDLAYVLGRSADAVKIKASRLCLIEGRVA